MRLKLFCREKYMAPNALNWSIYIPVIPFSSLLKIDCSLAAAFRDELPLGRGGWPLIDHWHSSLNHCLTMNHLG